MAKFNLELPTDIIKDIKKIHDKADDIFGEMTQAGAKVAAENIKANAPLMEIAAAVHISKVYKTPSDDGINTKVYFRGSLPWNREGPLEFTRRGRVGGAQYTTRKGIPVEFIAMVFEYGTSPRFTNNGAYRGYIGKKPYFRKGFKKEQIERAMLKVQKEKSGGLLDE